MLISEVISGMLAANVTFPVSVMVSAPLPVGQSPLAISVLAALIASTRWQGVPLSLTLNGGAVGVAVGVSGVLGMSALA